MPRRSCRLSAFVRSSPLSNRVRSFVLIAFVLLTALSLPPRVRGTSYSDVFPAALSNYAFGGWQGPFGDGTAGRLFPTSDGTGIYADATYNGLVWILRSSPEFSSIDMTMHFSIPNRDFTTADYFALLLILHSPTTPLSTPPGTNCDGTCSYVAGQSGFKLLYRIGFNQLVITNGPGNVTLSQVSLPPVALNQPHDARATYAAGNLTVYLDSVQLATLQIPNVPPGQIGFETYRTDLIVNTITLVGSVVPGFALSVNPARAVTGPSSSTNATMIVSSVGGFSGTVALSATASTSSLTPSLNPSSLVLAPGSNLTSTLTVDAGSFCGIGTVMVTGTSGSATSFVTFTVTVQCPFDYAVAWSPTSASITAPSSTTPSVVATLTSGTGTSVACTVTVPVANGLAASPTSFDITPAAAPGASSAVTISTTAVTPAGTYTIGVNCTGGAGTHAANFALTLCPCPFDYSLSVAPTTISLVQGTTSAPSTVSSLLVSGTSQPVTLSISGLQTGVIASMFTPNPVSPASPAATSTFTLTTAATAPVVSGVTITITGTSIGGLIRTTTFTLNSCSCGVDYSLSVAPTIVTLVQGTTSAASTVSALLVAGGAGMQTVTLSISGLPTGVTASVFTPNPVTPASPAATSTFTLTAAATAPVVSGVIVTITGTSSGGIVRTTTFTLNCVCAFDYSLSVAPISVALIPGTTSAASTVSALLVAGTAQPVSLSISGLPTGVTASTLIPNPVTPASPAATSTFTLTAAATAPPVSGATVTITGTSTGGVVRTTTFTLNSCLGSFDYSLSVAPTSVTLVQGTTSTPSTVAALLVAACGGGQLVTLSFSGLPTGVTASVFTPNPVTPASPAVTSTFTLTASAMAPLVSGVIVTITGAPLGRTATFTLNVVGSFDYGLGVAPTSVTLVQGTTSAASTVFASLVAAGAGVQTVTLSISGLPTGVTASAFTPNPVTPSSPAATSTFTLTAVASAPVVSGVTVTITGTSTGGVIRTTTFTLNVVSSFDYSLSVAPTGVTLVQGATSAASTVSALLVAAGTGSQAVTLSISGLPTGVTASAFTPNPVTPASPASTSTFTLTAAPTAPVVSGVTVTITGTSTGGVVRTTTFLLNVA